MTAEFAVLLPAVALLLAVLIAAGSAAADQVRCIDAARSAARLAARHETRSAVLAAARSAAPAGSSVQIAQAAGLVVVRVRAGVSFPLPGHPVLEVVAASTARLEEAIAASDSGPST